MTGSITGLITVVPLALVLIAGWQLWNSELHWRDVVIFVVMYVPVGLGMTVGFHRLLTHRSVQDVAVVARAAGGPRHDVDRGAGDLLGRRPPQAPHLLRPPGDPHSPHVDNGGGWRGALRGLAHAHVGWLFDHTQRGSRERFAPDLLADPAINFVDKTFLLWSLRRPGDAVRARRADRRHASTPALEAMLWGGAVRIFAAAPRHLLDQLAVSLLRPSAL